MLDDPRRRAAALAELFLKVEPSLWRDLLDSGAMPAASGKHDRLEWRCLALYACVRGLVAAGGFNTETVAAVDHLHALLGEPWPEPERATLAERYNEYGRIGQELEHAGAHHVTQKLGEACAAHIAGATPPSLLAELLGTLHESLAEGAADAVREGGR
ncbi:MAG: hypothetical protein ABIU54_10720 [Candidatus Eisenbacteria bacterium]